MGAVTRDTGHYVTLDTGYQPLTVLGRIVQLCALLHNTQPLRIFGTDHISESVNIPSVVLGKKVYIYMPQSHCNTLAWDVYQDLKKKYQGYSLLIWTHDNVKIKNPEYLN